MISKKKKFEKDEMFNDLFTKIGKTTFERTQKISA